MLTDRRTAALLLAFELAVAAAAFFVIVELRPVSAAATRPCIDRIGTRQLPRCCEIVNTAGCARYERSS